MGPVPKGAFLTKGVGKHREKLTSFELALRSAGIAEFNLVRVKSIFPPNCKLLSQQEGMKYLSPKRRKSFIGEWIVDSGWLIVIERFAKCDETG